LAAVNLKDKDATTKPEETVVKYGVRGQKIHPIFQALPADDEILVNLSYRESVGI